MSSNPITRRRRLGTACLLIAIGMLAGGETLLKGRLLGSGFVAYWAACFLFTGLAMVVAFLDARTLRYQTREEQRALFERTFRDVQPNKTRKGRDTAQRQDPVR